jgi:transcriptional regulator with XRE-family HTH domain
LTCDHVIATLRVVQRQGIAAADVYGYVGQAVARFRGDAGLSQAQLAAAIGLTRTSISNIEKGRQKMLVHTLMDIAASLSVPVASLLPSPRESREDAELAFSGSAVSAAERATIAAILDESASRGRRKK